MRSLRLLCPLACLAACRFDLPEVAVGVDTAPVDDSGGGGDMWTMVEELTVPSSGVAVTSQVPLQAGVRYQLRASGTYYIELAVLGDAEYHNFNFGPIKDGDVGIDVGLAVNDAIIDATRTPRWGPYNEAHVYEAEWMGEGQQITAQLHDGNFNNNDGELKLAIFAPR